MLMVRKRKGSLRMQFRNKYLILDFLSLNTCLPFKGNEPLIPLVPYTITLTLVYPWVEG
jgi:hypothetical protein